MWKNLLLLFALLSSSLASASEAPDTMQTAAVHAQTNFQLPEGEVVRWKDMPRDVLPDDLEVRGGRVFYHGVRIKGGTRYLQGVIRASDSKDAKRLVGRQIIHLGAGGCVMILFSALTVAVGVGLVDIVIFGVVSTAIFATSPSNRKVAAAYSEWAQANPDLLERPVKF